MAGKPSKISLGSMTLGALGVAGLSTGLAALLKPQSEVPTSLQEQINALEEAKQTLAAGLIEANEEIQQGKKERADLRDEDKQLFAEIEGVRSTIDEAFTLILTQGQDIEGKVKQLIHRFESGELQHTILKGHLETIIDWLTEIQIRFETSEDRSVEQVKQDITQDIINRLNDRSREELAVRLWWDEKFRKLEWDVLWLEVQNQQRAQEIRMMGTHH